MAIPDLTKAEEFEPVRGEILFASQYFKLLAGKGRGPVEWQEPLPAVWTAEDIEQALAAMESSPAAGAAQQFTAHVNPHDADGMGATTDYYFGSQVVAPGKRTPFHRHTAVAYYIIRQGEGYTDLVSPDGKRKTKIFWKRGTEYTCPAGWWHSHVNTGSVWMRISAFQNIPELARRWLLMFDEGSGYQPVGTDPAPQVESQEKARTDRVLAIGALLREPGALAGP